ncbi:MAG: glycosyltransferase family 9 protein [Bryobacteraceae bacterium]
MRRLLIRPGAIGDCILSLPALKFLSADYTEIWVPRPIVPLIRFADRVRAIADTGIDWIGLREAPEPLMRELRSFDEIVSWYGSNREEFREAVRTENLPFRFLRALPPENSREHAADFFLREAGGRGTAIPRIDCPSGPPSEFAVVHPFSGSARKNWPLERFRELAGCLGMPVQWCASPDEELEGAVRFDDLYELACWLAAARVYIGNDSGITHVAAAVGAPVIAIFGPTDPVVWGPRGDSVRIVSGQLDRIRVEDILGA